MNSEISENKVFIENPLEIFKMVVLPVTVTIFVIVVIYALSLEQVYRKGSKISHEAFILVIFIAVTVLNLILFFALSLVEKRIITCDSKGFNLVSTNYWNSYHKSESFLWNEISDSEIVLVGSGETETLVIEVRINQNTQRLLSLSLLSKNAFNDLIQFINRSTPHLQYIWKKPSEVSTGLVLVKRRGYCKVART